MNLSELGGSVAAIGINFLEPAAKARAAPAEKPALKVKRLAVRTTWPDDVGPLFPQNLAYFRSQLEARMAADLEDDLLKGTSFRPTPYEIVEEIEDELIGETVNCRSRLFPDVDDAISTFEGIPLQISEWPRAPDRSLRHYGLSKP